MSAWATRPRPPVRLMCGVTLTLGYKASNEQFGPVNCSSS